jgi:ATP/maltotriose-dependent transcriptional regulator MalT
VRAAAVELVNALAAAEVAHGLIVLDDLHRLNDPHIFELLQSGDTTHPLLSKLSQRELEVLERIARGDSNKLIACAFSLSPHTVKRHGANILDKLGVDTRGQAAACWRTGDTA